MTVYDIYTDGSCLKNPNGPGGWAFILLENTTHWSMVGNNPHTTNNRMELQAVIEALKFIKKGTYKIHTDSKWVINCATGNWNRKANLDQWLEYDKLVKDIKLEYVWVKSHNGNKYNEIVDNLAREEAKLIFF